MRTIAKVGFERPTAIQAQALPVVLSGRDVIGIAKTGSGKTMAFVWPLFRHIMAQPMLKAGDGPIGIILAPTRELAHQIFLEAKKFAKPFNIQICSVYGGVTKWEQVKALKAGCEIVVATPGRFIDIVKSKATNLARCTYLVCNHVGYCVNSSAFTLEWNEWWSFVSCRCLMRPTGCLKWGLSPRCVPSRRTFVLTVKRSCSPPHSSGGLRSWLEMPCIAPCASRYGK